ncbi:unnamed protein product [Brugia timori]|uniref:DUF5658 domain-containing protein n=1 Tax=Brugia timori TaxID=42155 RepID=A0A0R3Q7K9_9BILA|nr:unnamed protein product [Brugia timori]
MTNGQKIGRTNKIVACLCWFALTNALELLSAYHYHNVITAVHSLKHRN